MSTCNKTTIRNRRRNFRLLLALCSWVCFGVALSVVSAGAQGHMFTRDDLEYVLELPSQNWRPFLRADVHSHVEFLYGGDPRNGYLRLRKRVGSSATTAGDLFAQDEKWQFSQLPGYIACSAGKGTDLQGHYKVTMFSYEYTDGGISMEGLIYYIQVDSHLFYSLSFTGAEAKLSKLHAETNAIAESFRLK